MLLLVGSVLAGILIGLALGGSLRTLSEVHFRWWPLALLGLALQLVPVAWTGRGIAPHLGLGLLIASYVILLIFVAVNVRVAGFPLLAAGFALNALVISLNGGMPVSDEALREAYGSGYTETRFELLTGGGAKHHLASNQDVLLPFADVIPVGWPVGNVFSVGDILGMLGVVWVLAGGTGGRLTFVEGRARPGRVAGLAGRSRSLGRSPRPTTYGENAGLPPQDPTAPPSLQVPRRRWGGSRREEDR